MKIYFVTRRTSKYPVEKNAVSGEFASDNWVVTDHYFLENHMMDAVFKEIINNETLDRMLEDIKISGDGWSNKADAQKAREESNKLYKKLVKLFPTIALEYGDDYKKMQKEFNKTCKQMTLENKKKFIKIVKEYHGNEFADGVGIAYGVAKIK